MPSSKWMSAAVTATVVWLTVPQSVRAADIELGLLDCVVRGGSGFIFGSSKDLSCEFVPNDETLPREPYFGVINKFGIDLGTTRNTVIKWAVLAPKSVSDYEIGALAGNYVGASASASVITGAGVNVLVGGSARSFTLQPLSLQSQDGINVAVGLAEVELRSAAD